MRREERRTRDTLLGDHDIWLHLENLIAQRLHLLLLDLLCSCPIGLCVRRASVSEKSIPCRYEPFENSMFVCDSPFLYSSGQSRSTIRGFSMRLRKGFSDSFSPEVAHSPPHIRMRDILVHHHALQHLRVLDLSSRNLLHTCISLDVDRRVPFRCRGHRPYSLQSEIAHQVTPSTFSSVQFAKQSSSDAPGNKLGSNARLDQIQHLFVVADINRNRNPLDDLQRFLQRLVVRRNDDNGMEIFLELSKRLSKDLASYSRNITKVSRKDQTKGCTTHQ